MSTVLDDPTYDVLNATAMKKMASPAALAEATGLSAAEVGDALERLQDAGLVTVIGGDQALPTDQAWPTLLEAAARRYADLRGSDRVAQLHRQFETVNERFLQALADWQQVDIGGRKVVNDHTDAVYDERVLKRISALVRRLQRICTELAADVSRFDRYAHRLERSWAQVEDGAHDYVSSPSVDSIHNIWFEFHEDLLTTLGKERRE